MQRINGRMVIVAILPIQLGINIGCNVKHKTERTFLSFITLPSISGAPSALATSIIARRCCNNSESGDRIDP